MAILHHHPLDPASRRIRLTLAELGVAFELIEEKPGPARPAFLTLNPSGQVPVFISEDGVILAGAYAISEYLEETVSDSSSLIGPDQLYRAEVRRLVSWFDEKFADEVTGPIVGEKALARFLPPELGGGGPNMARVRAGKANLRVHLQIIGELAERRGWLAGPEISIADFAAAAHLSAIDYIGEVPWFEDQAAKTWYQRIKSRPCFRALLNDHVRGISAASHYADLDF
jgi:glutathione S-transferase